MSTTQFGVSLMFLLLGSAAHGSETAQASRLDERKYVPECAAYSFVGGRSYKLPLSRQEIEAMAPWNPDGREEPPVSAGEALRIARREFENHFKEADEWVLTGASLGPLCDKRWAWTFMWQPKQKGYVGSVLLPVLMSGTVIPLDRLVPTVEGH